MAANVLAVYNTALAAVGERTLDSTAENRYTRREMDKVWARGNGAIDYLLEQGLWNFAMDRSHLTSSASSTFGFAFKHDLPTDYLRLAQVSTSADIIDPLIKYEVEASTANGLSLLCESSSVYIRYVSNSTLLGADIGAWPNTFFLWAGHWLATQIYSAVREPRIELQALQDRTDLLLTNARQKNASEQPRPFPERDLMTIEHRELDYPIELIGRVQRGERR
jgi:hypothetical protein